MYGLGIEMGVMCRICKHFQSIISPEYYVSTQVLTLSGPEGGQGRGPSIQVGRPHPAGGLARSLGGSCSSPGKGEWVDNGPTGGQAQSQTGQRKLGCCFPD